MHGMRFGRKRVALVDERIALPEAPAALAADDVNLPLVDSLGQGFEMLRGIDLGHSLWRVEGGGELESLPAGQIVLVAAYSSADIEASRPLMQRFMTIVLAMGLGPRYGSRALALGAVGYVDANKDEGDIRGTVRGRGCSGRDPTASGGCRLEVRQLDPPVQNVRRCEATRVRAKKCLDCVAPCHNPCADSSGEASNEPSCQAMSCAHDTTDAVLTAKSSSMIASARTIWGWLLRNGLIAITVRSPCRAASAATPAGNSIVETAAPVKLLTRDSLLSHWV